jgi:hypothetical protein
MGLDWNFFRITPEQHDRLLTAPAFETAEAIHEERFQDGLGYFHNPGEGGGRLDSFDEVYHLGLQTDYDELDNLMTFEDDDGPVVTWPLGENGVKLSPLADVAYLLNPKEVSSLAPLLQQLFDIYLDRRYRLTLEEYGEDSEDLEEIYPELRECFGDLTRFVQTAARNGEAILWELS